MGVEQDYNNANTKYDGTLTNKGKITVGSGGYIGATSDGGTKRVTNNGNIEKHDQNDKVAILK